MPEHEFYSEDFRSRY